MNVNFFISVPAPANSPIQMYQLKRSSIRGHQHIRHVQIYFVYLFVSRFVLRLRELHHSNRIYKYIVSVLNLSFMLSVVSGDRNEFRLTKILIELVRTRTLYVKTQKHLASNLFIKLRRSIQRSQCVSV